MIDYQKKLRLGLSKFVGVERSETKVVDGVVYLVILYQGLIYGRDLEVGDNGLAVIRPYDQLVAVSREGEIIGHAVIECQGVGKDPLAFLRPTKDQETLFERLVDMADDEFMNWLLNQQPKGRK